MRGLIVATSCLLFGQVAFAQQNTLMDSITRELNVLQSITSAEPEPIERIKTALKPVVEQVERKSSQIEIIFGFIPPALYDAVAASARKELAKNPNLENYLSDLRWRREFKQQATAGLFMLQLDRAVELRRQQWKEAEKAVNELAKRAAVPSALAIEAPKLGSEAKRALKTLLTEQQFDFWEKNNALSVRWSYKKRI